MSTYAVGDIQGCYEEFARLLEEIDHPEWYHAWLGDERYALIAVSLVSSWQWVGLPTMMFLAGFINIPGDLSEAARVDGANGFQIWWRVKLPLIRPVMGIVAILITSQNREE